MIELIDISTECKTMNDDNEKNALEQAISEGYSKKDIIITTYKSDPLHKIGIVEGNVIIASKSQIGDENSTLLVDSNTKNDFIKGIVLVVIKSEETNNKKATLIKSSLNSLDKY